MCSLSSHAGLNQSVEGVWRVKLDSLGFPEILGMTEQCH